MKCNLCPKDAVSNGGVQVYCEDCKNKMNTHFAFVFGCCNRLYWLPKSPENVMHVANHEGITPLEAAQIGHIVAPMCKFCASEKEVGNATLH